MLNQSNYFSHSEISQTVVRYLVQSDHWPDA